jgi:hypothetical protein
MPIRIEALVTDRMVPILTVSSALALPANPRTASSTNSKARMIVSPLAATGAISWLHPA